MAWYFGARWCSYECAQSRYVYVLGSDTGLPVIYPLLYSVVQNPPILYYVRAELGPDGRDHFLTYEYNFLGYARELEADTAATR